MDDRLCIAVGAVAMPERLQRSSELGMIVDFAIEDDPDCAGLIADRLMSAGNINNAETAHSNADRAIRINALVIRPTMCHRATHPAYDAGISALVLTELHHSGNATHIVFRTCESVA